MLLRTLFVTMRKEILNLRRDRRLLFLVFFTPIIVLPALMVIGVWLANVTVTQNAHSVSRIAIVHSDALIYGALRDVSSLRLVTVSDPERALRQGEVAALLVVPRNLVETLKAGGQANLRLVVSPNGGTQALDAESNVAAAIATVSQAVAAVELHVHPQRLNPLRLSLDRKASHQASGNWLLSFFLPMIMIGGLTGALSGMASDATAGEKENRTMENLLLHPVSRSGIVLGKFTAVLAVGWLATGLMLMVTALDFRLFYPLLDARSASAIHLGFGFIAQALLGLLPSAAIDSALLLLAGFNARSMREATNLSGIISLANMAPPLALSVVGSHPALGSYFIPIFGSLLVLEHGFAAQATPLVALGTVWIVAVILTLMALAASTRLLHSERILRRV